MPNADPVDLSRTPIHLASESGRPPLAVILENFTFDRTGFEAYIAAHCSAAAPGRLVMIETTAADWSTWECHPLGDEIVIVLEGDGTFIQQVDGGEQHIDVSPGDTIINPKGVWHTADVVSPIKAVYITPCPETDHKPRD